MSQSTTTTHSEYQKAVRELVASHAEDPPEDLRIYVCRDDAGEIVRLIDVSEEFGDQLDEVVWSVTFRSTERIPYRASIILLTPADLERLRRGELRLPEEWPGVDCLELAYPTS